LKRGKVIFTGKIARAEAEEEVKEVRVSPDT